MSSLSLGRLATPLVYSILLSTAAGLPSTRPVAARDDAFTRSGCFTDGPTRALSADSTADDTMTVEMCAAYCSSYQYFGVEYGRECYCGNDRDASSVAAPDADCSFPCAGDATETCGAGLRLDVYTNNNYVAPSPTTSAPDGTPYLGCFADVPARALPEKIISEDDMTAAKCAANCEGYAYFGTQWSRECYCGNTVPAEDTKAPESDCNMPCSGDATEMCGAGMRLSVYGPVGGTDTPSTPTGTAAPTTPSNAAAVGNFNFDGCYADSIAQRVLTGTTITSPDMTLAVCATICADYNYFGVEYGTQCFCGMTLDASAAQSPEAEWAMKCGGDESLLCGDANRLSIYQKAPSDVPATPSNLPTVGTFSYQSCWTDAVGDRSLAATSEVQAGMTVEMCAAFCDGYAYFGLEYSSECYCGNELAGEPAAEAECSMLCAGSTTQWCGGPNRMNLYAVDPISPSSSAAPSVTSTPSTTPAAVSSTITPGPELTTVTSCGSSLVGGPQTQCLGQLPSPCAALSSNPDWFMAQMSVDACRYAIGTPLPTNMATCFPGWVGPTVTASSIYQCLQTNALCSYADGCTTATYTVGAEPTATSPPASPTGVLTNGGFESGDLSGWKLSENMTPWLSNDACTALARSGGHALQIVYQNENNHNSVLTQTAAVVPGANYTLSLWARHENKLPDCGINTFLVTPVVDTYKNRGELYFRYVAANEWHEVAIDFQAAGSWVTITINYYCNGLRTTGDLLDGWNTMYIDDVSLVRRDV